MISVIVPVYNTEKYLRRCIDSILAQTYSDFELILIDDGSTDNSGKICDDYAEKDNRIVVIHQKNQGQAIARNVGLDYVFEKDNSEWISFVDSDDYVNNHYLEVLFDTVKSNKAKISVCGYEIVKRFSEISSPLLLDSYKLIPVEELYCKDNMLANVPWAKLFSKELWKNYRFPEGTIHEDEYVIYKVLFSCDFLIFLSMPLYYFYHNEQSTMRKRWTPARLSALQGKQEQIRYMKIKGYDKAYRCAIFDYAQVTYWQLCEIKNDSQYQKEKKYLRKQLRKHLAKYRKTGVLSRRENKTFYDTAFPLEMKITDKVSHIKSRLYHLLIKQKYKPHVMSSKRTIKFILRHKCSVARFGDGEYQLMCKIMDIGFQKRNDELSIGLKEVLRNPPESLLLCIPNIFGSLNIYNDRAKHFWIEWKDKKNSFAKLLYHTCKKNYYFGDALFTRPYLDYPDDANAKEIFHLIKQLWNNRDVLIIEGEQTRLGVGNDLLDNVKSVQRILAPAENAFDSYQTILTSTKQYADDRLILIALGPTATVLACELSRLGFWAIDIGHVDIEYEWYLRKASDRIPIEGKYTNEIPKGRTFTECKDPKYQKQIIKVIN